MAASHKKQHAGHYMEEYHTPHRQYKTVLNDLVLDKYAKASKAGDRRQSSPAQYATSFEQRQGTWDMFEQLCPEKASAQVFPPGVGKPLPEDVRATAEETSAMSGTEMETSLRRKAYALISMAEEPSSPPSTPSGTLECRWR